MPTLGRVNRRPFAELGLYVRHRRPYGRDDPGDVERLVVRVQDLVADAIGDVHDVAGFHLVRLAREDQLGAAPNDVIDLIEGMGVFVDLKTRPYPDLARADISSP